MRSKLSFVGLAMALIAVPAFAADQPPKPPSPGPHPGDPVAFCGKVVPLVEMGCIGIVGLSGTIDLTSVSPKPEVGSTIQGAGVISGGVSKCMQGVAIVSATYSKTDMCGSGP